MQTIQLISAANATANQTSAPLNLGDIKDYSIQIAFSDASIGGTLQIQASNDGTNWSDVTGASKTVTGGVSHMFNITAASYRYARVTWTAAAGTGNLTATAIIKEYPIKGA